jgi:hypothetical protein
MSVLIIGTKERHDIRVALARAREKVIPFDVGAALAIDQATNVVTLEERRKGPRGDFNRPISEQVLLPIGYRLAISYEDQPAGLCLHLSMSVDNKPGALPHPSKFASVLRACGIDQEPGRTWIEEFSIDGRPGGLAINALFLIEPREATLQ